MSTAIVSSVPFGDFRDITMYKNQNLTSKLQLKAILADRKAVGAPIGFSTPTHTAIARRNSGTNASPILSQAAAALSLTNKLNNSLLCLNENGNNTSTLSNTTNTVTNNILSVTNDCIQQQAGHRKLDRSLSEPVNSAVGLLSTCGGMGLGNGTSSTVIGNGVATQNQGNSSRYKTELCRPYEESGACKYGDKCQFAHGAHELRNLARHPKYKTELCRTYHTTGFCPYGPRCHFIHNEQEDPKRSNSVSSSSSTCSSSNSSTSGKISPPPMPRPKALSVGSFSHMSTSSPDCSPPSSLSESPTNSISSFFDDTFASFPSSSQPATPTANNAFTYSTQDFTAALVVNSCRGNNNFNNKFAAQQLLTRAMNHMNLSNALNQQLANFDSVMDSGCRENSTYVISNLLSNGGGRLNSDMVSPPPETPASPTCIESIETDNCNGSFDINRSLRLPIFSQISVCNDD